ncbi:MAG: class I adenylate-forming enzyme family protein [Pseudomonadota bacterium]|nr:class I adenylate-forming enzyme family protein [Pseudomonadota bacterium]
MTSGRQARLDVRLAEACQAFADAPAVSDASVTLSYAALHHRAKELAEALVATGIRQDEPVIAAVSNQASDVAALLAVWQAGGVAVPMHRGATAANLQGSLARTGARFIVNALPHAPPTGVDSGEVVEITNTLPPEREILAGAAWIVFTSGSTGQPKGVVLAHDRYMAKLDAIIGAMALPRPQRVLMPLQMTFAYAHWVTLTTLLSGGEVFISNPFRPDEFLANLDRGITAAAVVPTMLRRLRPLIEQGRTHFTGTLMTGGESLPKQLGQFIRSAWPQARIWDVYGLTESATSDFYVRPEEHDRAAGCIGRPGPGVAFRIAPENGELQIRSPYLMRGYLDEPGLTDEAFEEGYLRTGDAARQREDGIVEITGRLKDLVNRAGNKIAPVEIEAFFLAHPDVLEALAAGAPDPRRGEALHVVVVGRQGATLNEDLLLRWADQRIERFKLPDRIHIAMELPVGSTGKADRNALRSMVTSGKLA